jgi:hypothetical protein
VAQTAKLFLKREAIVAVVTVTGTNGAEGEPGGPAVADAATAADSSNTATATGGNGGGAGAAGAGGNAQATATTTLVSAGATSASATAVGGGGNAPFPGEGGSGGAATATGDDSGGADVSVTASATGGAGGGGDMANGGSGGAATATGDGSGDNVSVQVSATGGAGNGGLYAGSGNGGVANGATATADGVTSALASVIQTGGDGGGSRFGGTGAASTLTNAVNGKTDDGSLTLEQSAIAGSGGYSSLTQGVGGSAADSSLTFDDTQNATQSASVTVDVDATAGAGGGGEGAGGGGDATAGATIKGADVNVSVGANGGSGGSGVDFGGEGGTANATANVTSTSGPATATLSATGGNGGGGGTGGAATANGLVSGPTQVSETVSATGGAGGSGGGAGGLATATGQATSSAGPATANVTATGGAGGSGNPGNGGAGGAATATADVTSAAGLATANATANGGSGGLGTPYQNGTVGSASATSTAVGMSVSSNATAIGGGSASALAGGTAASGTISVAASSSAVEGDLVTADSAAASGAGSGASSAEAAASIGVAAPSLAAGNQALALIDGAPGAGSVSAITSANSNIAAAFATDPTYFGIAELGGASTAAVASPETISADVELTVDMQSSADDLVLGFYDGTAAGAGLSNLTLTVTANGTVDLTKSFDSLASLDDYFTDNAVGPGSLPSEGSTLNLDIALSLTTDTAGSGYEFGVLVGGAAESSPTIDGTVADQAITDDQTIVPFSGVAIQEIYTSSPTYTLSVALSDAANGTLFNLAGGAYDASTGVYTDTGTASALTAALDGLIFAPTPHHASPGLMATTTFTISVGDGVSPTVTNSTTTVVTTSVNNAPTIAGAVADQAITDTQSDQPFSGVTISDIDVPPQTLTLTVALSAWANGTLSNLGGGYYDPATGIYSVSGTAAGLTAALDALTFTPTEHQVAAGSTVTTTFTIGVNDGVAPTVTNSATSVVTTATANTATGPTVKIVGTDGLVSSGGSTTTMIVGTVADNVAINSVTLYSGATELGVATIAVGGATLNGDASWSFDASFGPGTYSDIVAVATDVDNHTSSATAPFDLITGVTGSPYTSQEKTFNSAGLLVGRTYFNYDGSVYTAGTVERLPDGNVGYLYATGTAFEGQSYTSYESYFSSDGDEALYEGTTTNYTGITGQSYTGLSVSVDPYNRLTSQVFTGVTFQPFSSYEYDYVGGVYAGAQYDFTSVPSGASYSSYETDYNFANALVGDKFFFTNIQGQSYTGEQEDFDANGDLSEVLLTGVTDQAYTSLEEDYSAGVYEGYKAFYSITDRNYTGEEVDVSASNAITGVAYTGLTDTPYSSVQETYANGAVTSTTYDFTDQSGQDYYAYQVTKGANGAPLQEIVDNDDGSHSIVGYQSNQTFTSIGDDNFAGGGASETFVFQPVYGHDTINDFVSYLTGTGHDTISLSTSEFASVSAVLNSTQDVDGSAVITAPNGDTITLVNVSEAMLSANQGDFTFHS